jgi:hypothetical protein
LESNVVDEDVPGELFYQKVDQVEVERARLPAETHQD